MEWLDVFPKTLDDFRERTVGGGAISLGCVVCGILLVLAECSTFRSLRSVDRLTLDLSNAPSGAQIPLREGRLLLNVDLVLPSLPCSEFVMDVTDESGSQQLHVERDLHKLRIDRRGVPIDLPERVAWDQAVAPGFEQRKVRGERRASPPV
eukprot:scaffold199208_cov33-Tisochrysis_lutea.AAC.5